MITIISFMVSILYNKGRTIRKIMGGGGRGMFGEFFAGIFFVIKFLVGIFILGHRIKIFLGLIDVHEFFSFNFPLREYFFCTSLAPLPPHKFSNG